jgi:hypothetical protein
LGVNIDRGFLKEGAKTYLMTPMSPLNSPAIFFIVASIVYWRLGLVLGSENHHHVIIFIWARRSKSSTAWWARIGVTGLSFALCCRILHIYAEYIIGVYLMGPTATPGDLFEDTTRVANIKPQSTTCESETGLFDNPTDQSATGGLLYLPFKIITCNVLSTPPKSKLQGREEKRNSELSRVVRTREIDRLYNPCPRSRLLESYSRFFKKFWTLQVCVALWSPETPQNGSCHPWSNRKLERPALVSSLFCP